MKIHRVTVHVMPEGDDDKSHSISFRCDRHHNISLDMCTRDMKLGEMAALEQSIAFLLDDQLREEKS